ncbi:MAG: excinuclease ABC subunit UvrC, partial [Chloroflexota bacterium]
VFFLRKGLIIGRDIFQLDGTLGETNAEVLRSFVEQFYESAIYIPARVLLPVKIDDSDLIGPWLSERRGRPVTVTVPERGEKRELVQRAMDNARESLQQARARWMADRGKKEEALQQLQDELNLPALPRRIECYDISTIQGTSAVGSMVVFEDGNPKRSEYRRFRIKGVAGQNDFAMMQEVLKRRFWRQRRQTEEEGANEEPLTRHSATTDVGARRPPDRDVGTPLTSPGGAASVGAQRAEPPHTEGASTPPQSGNGREYDESFGAIPDLVIVDGGKGQVSVAHDAMRNLGVGNIPLAGLAKRFEELYVKDVSEPIVLDRTSQALYLVQRIRDEAHRFAITYHRDVRKKSGLRSALDDVPG